MLKHHEVCGGQRPKCNSLFQRSSAHLAQVAPTAMSGSEGLLARKGRLDLKDLKVPTDPTGPKDP